MLLQPIDQLLMGVLLASHLSKTYNYDYRLQNESCLPLLQQEMALSLSRTLTKHKARQLIEEHSQTLLLNRTETECLLRELQAQICSQASKSLLP